jgi:membrane fusion protein, heavy metal efflux system
MKAIVFPFMAFAVLALNACSDSDGKDTNQAAATKIAPNRASAPLDSISLTTRQLQVANIKLVGMQAKALQPVIYANGIVELLPDSKAQISSQIEGKIEQIFVREGQSVRKGQPLARLSSFQLLELQNDYAAAHSDVEFLRAEYNRQDELRRSNVGVLANYQATDAKLKAAIARERSLKSKLELLGISTGNLAAGKDPSLTSALMIRSPIGGFVFKFHQNIGSTVNAQTLLAEIINPDRVQATISVYEKDAPYVREGQAVELSFPGASSGPVRGRVAYISRSLDTDNRAITVHVNFQRPRATVLADMNVQARLVGSGQRVSSNTLPRTAILDDGEAHFVFVTNQPATDTVSFRRQKVEVIQTGESFVEVRPVGQLPTGARFASNNVLALEAERKKNE